MSRRRGSATALKASEVVEARGMSPIYSHMGICQELFFGQEARGCAIDVGNRSGVGTRNQAPLCSPIETLTERSNEIGKRESYGEVYRFGVGGVFGDGVRGFRAG